MEFRLVYEGPLKAAGPSGSSRRGSEKHEIRKALHKQLAQLWQAVPTLRMRTSDHMVLNPGAAKWDQNQRYVSRTMATSDLRQSLWKTLGDKFDRGGFKFVPLVCDHLNLSCGLDILFLRRDMPGVPLIRSGGDIDNRLKVLLDALRIPESSELAGATRAPDEDPYFFCLLEDDRLITEVAVTTDTLLTPYTLGGEHEVHLVIRVKIRPTEFSFENVAFLV